MSFFAFTATPQAQDAGDLWSRGASLSTATPCGQAIEEGFIEDVLKSYVQLQDYYKLIKKAEDDPNVERKKAAKALARFMRLHPHNIGQKTEVMVEHFQHFTRHKIGGHAEAMLVTGSRLEAVRYKQEFDRYISEKGYPIKAWSLSSGTVEDDKIPEKSYTEVEMNSGVKEKELARCLRQAGLPSATGGREIPNRLRSAAAAHDVCGQALGRHPGCADAVAA